MTEPKGRSGLALAAERLGERVYVMVQELGAIFTLFLQFLSWVLRPPSEIRNIVKQMEEVGVRSMPVVLVTATFTGMVLALQSYSGFQRFQATSFVGSVVALSITRELGPVFAGLMVSGRVGAAMAAELGTMKVTEQIDALEAVAVDSFRYLVVTRVLACLVAFPILTTVMNFAGIFGAWLAEYALTAMPLPLYFERAFSVVGFAIYVPSTLKTMVFGLLVAATGAWQGLGTTGGTEGVGRAATRSVVMSSVLLIVANVVLVKLIFFLFPELT